MFVRPTIMEQNFDSVLSPAQAAKPAELIIRLRVALVPYDPSGRRTPRAQRHITAQAALGPAGIRTGTVLDTDSRPFKCRTWLQPEFNAFTIQFKKMVELSWNNQLILLPPEGTGYIGAMNDATYREFIGRKDAPAHVVCSMDIQILNALHPQNWGRGPHAVMDVVRLDKPADGQFRSNQSLITNEDLEFRRTGGSLRQVTAAHEVGHWLGSPVPATDPRRYMVHVAAPEGKNAEPNHEDEYGRGVKRMALMGMGQLLTEHEARPWLERVRLHTGALVGWEIVHRIHFSRAMGLVSARQKRLAP